MKRPGIVTGLACFNLMGALSAAWLLGSHMRIGVDEVFLGSAFPIEWQWHWLIVSMGINCVTTTGLFLGWNWARWLLLALAIPHLIITFPLGNAHMLPSFLFGLAAGMLAYWLIFFSPAAKLYFSRPAKGQSIFAIRGVISTISLIFAVCAAYLLVMAVFEKILLVKNAWFGVAVFVLPALLLTLIIRWSIETSLREISALLLAVAIHFAGVLCSYFLAFHFAYPDTVMSYFDWLQSALLTLAFGAGGLLLAAYVTHRYHAAST